MITHQQLVFAIQSLHPELVHGTDYWVGQEMEGDTQIAEAKVYEWRSQTVPEPEHETLIGLAVQLLPDWLESIKPPPKTVFSVRDFAKRLTLAEQIAIRQASMTDMEVGLVYDDFNRAQFVDVTDPDVAMGLDLYTSKGLIEPERKAELLAPEAA